MRLPLYLDYAATTPVDPRVAEQMVRSLSSDSQFGNPSSTHVLGQDAKQAIDQARESVAHLINAHPNEIIWTSGATESNNLALKGAASLYQAKGKHIVTVKTEHPSVLDCCQHLEKQGFFVTYLSPEPSGLLDVEKLEAALRDDTILVSVMHVNNEIGVMQDIPSIAKLTAARGILFHVDAAQSVGKIPIDLQKTHIDLMSFCAHKMYGPKGIGALYVRRMPRVRVAAQIHGGGQEQGMRSGTLPTHQIVGMGVSAAIAQKDMTQEWHRLHTLRDQFWQGINRLLPVKVNGDMANSFPGILNMSFPGHKAKDLINALPELAIATGSACSSKGSEPSYVLRALGLSAVDAASSLRFSFGRFTTENEIETALHYLARVLS